MRKLNFKRGIVALFGVGMSLFATAVSAQMTKVVLSGPTPGSRILAKNEGDAISSNELKVTVTGGYTPGTVYIWKKDGVAIPNASTSSATYTAGVLYPADAGVYTCTVTRANSATDATTVTMDADSVCNLTVATSTTVPSTTPWFRTGVSPTFKTFAIGAVYNMQESALSQTLGIITAFDTTGNGYIGAGKGDRKISNIQWFRNGVEINANSPGFTAADFGWTARTGPYLKLTTTNSQVSANPSGDQYYCKVGNTAGTVTTGTFNIAIIGSASVPTFTRIDSYNAPADPNVTVYDTMFLGSKTDFINVSTSNAITYQWYKGIYPNGTAISGATSTKYVPSSGAWAASDAGTYYLKAMNGTTASSPAAFSNPIQIAVIDPATTKTISIVANPKDVTIAEGDTLKLSVVANITKAGNNSYQWYANGNLIPSGSGSDLALALTSISDTGTYYCKLYNEVDSLTSATVKVTMTREPIPLFNNLADVYDGVINLLSPQMKVTVKGVLSETLTTWQAVDSKGTIIPLQMDEVASRQTHRLYRNGLNSALPVGKYTIRVTNADGTLVVEKAVEIK